MNWNVGAVVERFRTQSYLDASDIDGDFINPTKAYRVYVYIRRNGGSLAIPAC